MPKDQHSDCGLDRDVTPYLLVTYTHAYLPQWSHTNHDKLLSVMTEEDKRIFDFDIRNFDWKQYVDAFCMGTKKYLFNEDLSKLPIARRQIKRWASVGCVDPRFMLIVASFPDQTGNEANRNDNFIALLALVNALSFAHVSSPVLRSPRCRGLMNYHLSAAKHSIVLSQISPPPHCVCVSL